ncbi:MAG: glycosyltransferase family 2 protein [Planctomycetaceae bacterium]|nr:glycosyltransferase family 2 protein [Planctomycetaceae bacterium]
MSKLIIQIPCYNEAHSLPQTLAELPRELPGFDSVEWLVIDDGSSDGTSQVARELGVDHVIRHTGNRGLAKSFRTGLDAALQMGADVIVNTDGDNQYPGYQIGRLVAPILAGEADLVIGDRQTRINPHFSWGKRQLQWLGSFAVRQLSNTDTPDTVSGFRAFSREAALRMNVVSSFSYTIETLIQAGNQRLKVMSIPITTNGKLRESRLFQSIPQFLARSSSTMLRVYSMYRPLKVFFYFSACLSLFGLIPILRFLYYYFVEGGAGHIQSLVLGGVLLLMGFITFLFGMVADLIAVNRSLLEEILKSTRNEKPLISNSAFRFEEDYLAEETYFSKTH